MNLEDHDLKQTRVRPAYIWPKGNNAISSRITFTEQHRASDNS